MADPAVQILKKTVPADIAETKKSIATLSGNSKTILKQSPLQFLPFGTVTNVSKSGSKEEEKPFLTCSYNQISQQDFLSPNSHRVFTIIDGNVDRVSAPRPVADDQRERDIRNLEKAANEVWFTYTQLYYGWEGVGSVFFKPISNGYMEGIYGIHKDAENGKGGWDSVHVVQVDEPQNGMCNYRVDSAVVMWIQPYEGAKVSSSLQKETVKSLKMRSNSVQGSHLENLGKIIEDVEIAFRSKLERIDIPQSLDIVESMYKTSRDAVSGAIVADLEESEMPMRTTGMSVGSAMIGDIASKAREAKAKGNDFLDRMKAQQDAKESQIAEQNQDYLSTKSSLKSPKAVPKGAVAPPASPAPEFLDFRNKLKKSG